MRKILLLISLFCAMATGSSFGQNTDISGGLLFEGEPYMAIDPGNARHIVVAWMGTVPFVHTSIKIKTTFDGGATWSAAAALPHHSPTYGSADVSMVFDHSGNVYVAYVDYRKSPDSGAVYVCRSTDGGITWGAASEVINGFADGAKRPIDRPWMAISRTTGATPDTLYITTKPAPWVAPPNRPYFTRSYDYGITWSGWRYIDSAGYLVGNVIQAPMAAPAVDSAGRIHCLYPTYLVTSSIYPRYILATGGPANSFSYQVAYTVMGAASVDTLAKTGGRLICDPTHNGHHAFFLIEDLYGDADVFCFETWNGGATWSAPARVNDDATANGKMQDLVWANFDEHGNIVAAWRDRRNAAGTGYQQPSEIWGAIKWHDSTAYSANFRISDTIVAYDSVYLSGSGNDFMNVAMAQDTLSAVWGDVRTGALNIWFSRKAVLTGVTTMVKNIVSDKIPVVNIYPNPCSQYMVVTGAGISSVVMRDATGRQVLAKDITGNKTVVDVSALAPGIYTTDVITANGITTVKTEVR